MKSTYKNVRDLWDMGNRSNICIIGDQKGRETEKDAEEIHKGTIAKNFLNIIKDFKPPKKKKIIHPTKRNTKE